MASKLTGTQKYSKEPLPLTSEILEIATKGEPTLTWASGEQDVIIKGTSDLSLLTGFRNSLLTLRADFLGNESGKIILEGDKR